MGRLRVPVVLCLAVAAGLAGDSFADAPRSSARRRRAAAARPRRPPALPSLVVPAAASARDLEIGEACRRGLGGHAGRRGGHGPLHRAGDRASSTRSAGWRRAYQPCSVFKIVVADRRPHRRRDHPGVDLQLHTAGAGCGRATAPIDLRRALAQSCNPYFEWVGERLGYERVQQVRGAAGPGQPSGINLDGRGGGPHAARPSGPSQVGPSLEPCRRHHDLRRPDRRAPLRDHQRRDHVPAAGERRRGLRAARALAAAPGNRAGRPLRRLPGRGQRGQRRQRVRSGRDRGREDGHVRRAWAGSRPMRRRTARSRGGGLRAAGQRPRGLRRGRRASTRPLQAGRAASPRRRAADASARRAGDRERLRSASTGSSSISTSRWSGRLRTSTSRSRVRKPGRTTSMRWRPGSSRRVSTRRPEPRNSPST